MRWKFRSGHKLISGLTVWRRSFETDVAKGHRSKHLDQVNTLEEKRFNYLTNFITAFPMIQLI